MTCPRCHGTRLDHYPSHATSATYARHTAAGPLKRVGDAKDGALVNTAPVELGEQARYWCNDCLAWCSSFAAVPPQHPSLYREDA